MKLEVALKNTLIGNYKVRCLNHLLITHLRLKKRYLVLAICCDRGNTNVRFQPFGDRISPESIRSASATVRCVIAVHVDAPKSNAPIELEDLGYTPGFEGGQNGSNNEFFYNIDFM